MGKIYTLTFEEYCKLVTDIGLDLMPADTFGLNPHFPMKDMVNVKNLYDKYIERENWFEYYLNHFIVAKSKIDIIWSEASKFSNDYYVYKQFPLGTFINYGKKNGYFSKVTEAVFGSSICIDFYSPFGFNHTSKSREYLNKIYNNNSAIYNSYLEKYITSILNIIGYKYNQVMSLSNIIAAPKDTRDSILNFFSSELKSTNLFKCYFLSQQSVTSKFDNLDLTKAIALRKKK